MKLDVSVFRHMSATEFRVLVSVELGMKNHEYVSLPLIHSISGLRISGLNHIIGNLLKQKYISHTSKSYDGYQLTSLGYDCLALRTFIKRGHIEAIDMKCVGVGKEADIHMCKGTDGQILCIKFHRLGRNSFKTIKLNRDYLKHTQSYNWMYTAKIAALKEYTFMKALHTHQFPTPTPIDVNRHAILMTYIDAIPLHTVKHLQHPLQVMSKLLALVVRLAHHGLIHCDFNEFNLLIDSNEKITMIDFPQIISTKHLNAEMYFDRDIKCVVEFFRKKFDLIAQYFPQFGEVLEDLKDGDATPLQKQLDEYLEEFFEDKNDPSTFIDDTDRDLEDAQEASPGGSSSIASSENDETEEEEDEGSSSDGEQPEEQTQPSLSDIRWKKIPRRHRRDVVRRRVNKSGHENTTRGNFGEKKNRKLRNIKSTLNF